MADAPANIALTTTSSRHLTDVQKVKLQKATREFESMFVSMMLKSMRGSQGEESNEFGGESYGADTMKSMFDTELSKHVGSQGKLGIAESLYRKLTGEPLPRNAAATLITEKIAATAKPSRKKSSGFVQETIPASSASSIQQFADSADDSTGETDGESAILSLTSIMERLQGASFQSSLSAASAQALTDLASDTDQVAAVSQPAAAPPTVAAWTSTTIDAQKITLPPSPQAEKPARAALTASAEIMAQPARRDAVKTTADTTAKSTSSAIDRLKTYETIIARTADTVGVDANLLKAMIVEESGAKQHARSASNAKGLMQLIDTTAESMGVKNVWDPHQNIQGGARYLKQQLDKFNGNVSLALASYNAGPGNVERYNGIPPFRETQNYVKRVMKTFHALQSMERNSDDVIK
jgi:soluble lytic murein transglycosylase-like protein